MDREEMAKPTAWELAGSATLLWLVLALLNSEVGRHWLFG